MIQSTETSLKRILLTSVFGPYGVDDKYGRKENIMELFHNQVTKAQGVASFRYHHPSIGLHFLAANIDADVTVLDFPSKKRFAQELKNGYDLVGISFITPNFVKAREMALMIRTLSPNTEIVLGGHGAAIEGVEDLIDCDYVVKGEGIGWMREHLGQDSETPVFHPALWSTTYQRIMGTPLNRPTTAVIVPGLGCVNGCSFCSTTHFFGKEYASYIETGKELFETVQRISDTLGANEFFIMDENFLKNPQRVEEFMLEMERHNRFFQFRSIFSSCETIIDFGIDNLVRLGVTAVWVGFESRSQQEVFAKNAGVDAKKLVNDLKSRGISVLGSGILFLEHHTPDTIQADIDFLIDLEPDMLQFMQLTPLPVTGLYQDLQKRGLLKEDLPFEEWHGQKELAFQHPSFGPGEPEEWLNRAFSQDYHKNSSSILRLAKTALRGYEYLAGIDNRDACLEARMEQLRTIVKRQSLVLPAIRRNAVNAKEKRRAEEAILKTTELVGSFTLKEKIQSLLVMFFAALWKLRVSIKGDVIQPKTIRTHYPARERPNGH